MPQLKDQKGLTRRLKDLAQEKGADLVGIAPLERFASAPPDQHPTRYLPEAKAVISMGIRVNRAGLKTILSGTSIYSYCVFGFKAINERLNHLAYQVARLRRTRDSRPIRSRPMPPATPGPSRPRSPTAMWRWLLDWGRWAGASTSSPPNMGPGRSSSPSSPPHLWSPIPCLREAFVTAV